MTPHQIEHSVFVYDQTKKNQLRPLYTIEL